MNPYRITKYNPALRNIRGAYLPDEWTKFGQIGKKIGGATLTFESYAEVENNYINTAVNVVRATGLVGIKIKEFGWKEENNYPKSLSGLATNQFAKAELLKMRKIKDGTILELANLPTLIKFELRDICTFKLEYPRKFYLHFGLDLYMYIGTAVPKPELTKIATSNNLYAEEFKSPYTNP
jgi:hypothetical protein